MKIKTLLESRLRERFQPLVLEARDESPQHNVPSGAESHFRVLIVSKAFEGLSLVQRQRMVHKALEDLIKEKIHAFSQQALTPKEFEERGGVLPDSPPCAHKKI